MVFVFVIAVPSLSEPGGHKTRQSAKNAHSDGHENARNDAARTGDWIQVPVTDGGDGDLAPPNGVFGRFDVGIGSALFDFQYGN